MFTTKKKFIIGRANALKFAEENCTYRKERIIDDIKRDRYHCWSLEQLSVLVVPSVSVIVEVFPFEYNEETNERFRTEPDHWSLGDPFYGIQILATGEVLRIWCPDNKGKRFGLSLLERNYGRLKGFDFNEPKPNYIGKADAKKLRAWVEHVTRERMAEGHFMANAYKRNFEFYTAVKERFPDATLSVAQDGWLKCAWFEQGPISFRYEANDNGSFTRTCSLIYDKIPSTKDLLGID